MMQIKQMNTYHNHSKVEGLKKYGDRNTKQAKEREQCICACTLKNEEHNVGTLYEFVIRQSELVGYVCLKYMMPFISNPYNQSRAVAGLMEMEGTMQSC